MRAIVTTRLGGPEVLELRDVPEPRPNPGEVVVGIEAVGVNFADLLSNAGRYGGGPQPPFVGGREFAGTIAGSAERVMGYTEYGAYAERIAVPRERLWPQPQGWKATEAAAFPVNYFTAYLAYWKSGVLPQDWARHPVFAHERPRGLIHAVAGGVGTAAVEIGSLVGLEMWGTSSSDDKLGRVQELGLQHGINYTRDDYEKVVRDTGGVDCVLEMLGGEDTAKSVRCLRAFGSVIQYGSASGKPPELDVRTLYAKQASVHGLWLSRMAAHPAVMQTAWQQLSAWASEGKLRPQVGHLLSLEKCAEAQRLLMERKNYGKVVLTV
jgi:NADPH2:quinone reductase